MICIKRTICQSYVSKVVYTSVGWQQRLYEYDADSNLKHVKTKDYQSHLEALADNGIFPEGILSFLDWEYNWNENTTEQEAKK